MEWRVNFSYASMMSETVQTALAIAAIWWLFRTPTAARDVARALPPDPRRWKHDGDQPRSTHNGNSAVDVPWPEVDGLL